ncbi:MAG: translation elongation factor 4 [Bdellovibrionales bacterium]
MSLKSIRNFSIIAHIDHGKSTLADCFLEYTKAVDERTRKSQFLDSMDIERERGITIKAQTVRLSYNSEDGEVYQFNLIDTPGHVDFSYEVSRSLSACEGALLVVDACQGIEAQTMANAMLALENDLEIIPVINKIDLPSSRIEEVKQQLVEVIGVKEEDILLASAKEKRGIGEILEAVVKRVPPPSGQIDRPLQALIFDSWFDSYQGIITLCRIKEGAMKKGDKIYFIGTKRESEILKLGIFNPFSQDLKELKAGEVGFVITGVKEIQDVRVGDTLTQLSTKDIQALEGFQKAKPMVFSGIFPVDTDDFEQLKKALTKLTLNDSSLTFEVETSKALGFGFRCGFLGLLHMEIIQERLEREFELNLITTAPTVVYKVHLNDGKSLSVENPSLMPEANFISKIEEPYILLNIHTPADYVGRLLKLCQDKRGEQRSLDYISSDKVIIRYKLPLNEMVLDFYDRLKSLSRGYASMEYEIAGYEEAQLVKMDILLNGESVDALSIIVHHRQAEKIGRKLAVKLKEFIPRQQYQVAIQAAIGAKIIARETIGALRKDVTAKCYGGDVTRKRKLLEKQKAGKKRMKSIGQVEVPQKAFLAILKTDSD